MKFRLKMALCMLGVLAALYGVGGSLLITISFHQALEREWDAAYESYQAALGTLEIVNGVSSELGYQDIEDTLVQFSARGLGSWSAIRLYAPDRPIFEKGDHPAEAMATPGLLGSCTESYLQTESGHFILVTGGLVADGEQLTLDIAREVTQVFATRDVQIRVYCEVFLVLVALCAVLSYSISYVLTRPIQELSRASNAIAGGQLSRRAAILSNDEVGRAARDFNRMAESLENSIAALTASVERQERFIGSFAHEAKTPLTSILGYADLIRSDVLTPEERGQAANFIVSEGRRLELLSQKLLELLVVKNGDIALVPTRPAVVVQNLCNHLRPLYKKQGITLSCACQDMDGVCLMDADLVRSLLFNLLDNARKAVKEGNGRIQVRCAMLPDGCRILVKDNGKGIPAEALEHLTEAFYRVDKARARAQGGSGLGLALCSEIVKLHKGNIRFNSEPGIGTAVLVELRGGVV